MEYKRFNSIWAKNVRQNTWWLFRNAGEHCKLKLLIVGDEMAVQRIGYVGECKQIKASPLWPKSPGVWCCQNTTLSSIRNTAHCRLPPILYRTHIWLNITVAKSQQFPSATPQKVIPPWAVTAASRNAGRQGAVFYYPHAHFLTMRPFSLTIAVTYFTGGMRIYQTAVLGVCAPLLWY